MSATLNPSKSSASSPHKNQLSGYNIPNFRHQISKTPSRQAPKPYLSHRSTPKDKNVMKSVPNSPSTTNTISLRSPEAKAPSKQSQIRSPSKSYQQSSIDQNTDKVNYGTPTTRKPSSKNSNQLAIKSAAYSQPSKAIKSSPVDQKMQTSIESQNQESPLSPRRRSRVIFSNEPISVRAMKNLGFTKEDLEYPSEARINEFTRNPAFKSFVREELTKDVDERLKLFNEEKQRIKEEDEQRKQENLENTESEDQSEFDFESIELKMQRTIERHKKQIELKIFQALAEKYRKENEIKRAELEQLRLEEFRQSIIQKHMIEEENNARRQEFFNQKETERMERIELYMKAEAERQQKYLQRKEEEKIKREQEKMEFEQMLQEKLLIHNEIERQKDETRREQLKSKLLILEERERRVQQSRQEAMIRFKTKNDQKQEIHNQLKSEIDSIRQKKINSLRKKAAERDAQLQEKLRKLDEEKKQILLEKRSKTEIVVQRAQMVREEKQKEKEKVNEIYIQRQKRAEEKLKQMEEERYLDYIQSLEIEKSIKERLRLLKEEQENEIRRKHDEVYEKDRIRTKQIEEKRQEEAFEREFEALKEKIAVSRKQFNLLVKERQQSLLNQEKQTEMVQKMKELAEKENRRKQKLILYLQQKQIAESKIRYFEQKISEELSMAKTEGQLRQIAENYDIDFESIDAKARNPKGNRQTINDFITQMGGNTSTLKDNE